MENRNDSGARAGVMGGKGFYLILLLCAAVIGVSAWILLAGGGTKVDDMQTSEQVVDVSGATVTMLPADWTRSPEETVKPTATAKPVADDADETENDEAAAAEDSELQAVFSETVTTYVWPVRGDIEAPYAVDTLVYNDTMADWRTHDGIDIACALGEQVLASAGGTVVSVTQDDLAGTMVEIDHANGVHSVYGNLAAEPTVSEGDVVTMGQVIGAVGSTALGESSLASHLHFAMKLDGISADPMNYLPET